MTSTRAGQIPPPQSPNTLTLKKLDAASQAGRVSLPGQTRGQKADRLQLVAKIAPVASIAENNWSATGVAIQNGTAYVSWHSNRQAANKATDWGGALDVINIADLAIQETLTGTEFKFNNVVAAGSNLYFPITSYNKGAVVGRLAVGSTEMDTISVPGVSANAIAVSGTTLRVVTGYKGGVYSLPTMFNENTEVNELIPYSETFGGKYIVGDYVLRTDDEAMEVVNIDGTRRHTGDPLVSAEKQAENYSRETGEWTLVSGTEANHYGKHTMAIDGNYTYVAGGQGENGKNGLRVYAATGLAWDNGTNTTAVCVEGDYVYAATGAGLRVYEKYVSEKSELPLYAYEVLNYDEDGNAADAPGSNKPVAGTDAHSPNFVAVDAESGYIFVACGQSGVYVFKLDTTVEPGKQLTGFQTTTGVNETREIEEETSEDFIVPAAPTAPAGKEFEKWVDENDETNEYNPGDKLSLEAGTLIMLKPVYKDIIYTVKFDLNGGDGNAADQQLKYGETPEWPAEPTKTDCDFAGWSVNGTPVNPADYTVTGDVTFTATWSDHVYKYILKLDSNRAGATLNGETMPIEIKSDNASIAIPSVDPVRGKDVFKGWSTNNDPYLALEPEKLMQKGATVEFTEEGTITVYALWLDYVEGEGGNGGDSEAEKPNQGGGSGEGGASDSGSGY